MHGVNKLRVKICCIANEDEAWMAIEHGASAIGLVSQMPSGAGIISDEMVGRIAAIVPPAVSSFLLTSRQDASAIIEQHRHARTNTIQICDRLESGSYEELRNAMPGISLVQVIHVTGREAIDEALEVAPHVDAVLVDSGNPKLAVKELGGTGRTHDWGIACEIREAIDVPLFLAGGLRPDNVVDAIRAVEPYGIDVCSGVRTSGNLDSQKLAAFFRNIESMELG